VKYLWLHCSALLAWSVGCQDVRPPASTIFADNVTDIRKAVAVPPCDKNEATASNVHGRVLRPHRHQDVVECPLQPTDNDLLNARNMSQFAANLIDTASAQLDANQAAAAWTCADRAVDLAPRSVDAHLLRGSALLALGRYEEAAVSYSMALALSPDDPYALRTVADGYLRARSESVAATTYAALGLELATRGLLVAKRKKPADVVMLAELATLRAEALNYVGRGPEALIAVDEALRYSPHSSDAIFERATALFDLHRFVEAKHSLDALIAMKTDDAAVQDLMGQTLEWLGDSESEAFFARARALAPDDFVAPQLIAPAAFQSEIDNVIASLPSDKQQQLKAVRIEIADLPSIVDLESVSPPFPPSILGLFRGDWPAADGAIEGLGSAMPKPLERGPSIVLYRKNLARVARTRDELSEQIRDTLLHEIGHFDGLDEDDLRRRRME
jgi:tetratricopeptide (TPR) repeat protein